MDLTERLRAAGCVFAEDEAAVLTAEARDASHLEQMVRRRVDGEPLEQIVGWAEFAGLRLVVTPGVFVPRRRTEVLAREAIAATPRPDASSTSAAAWVPSQLRSGRRGPTPRST